MILKRFSGLIYYIFHKVFTKDKYKMNIGKWFWRDGSHAYLTNYNLNNNSLVFDVGGYVGKFSDKIISKYNPRIYIFEPVRSYYDVLKNKYKDNKKVEVYNIGLSNKTEKRQISVSGDSSSIFTRPSQKATAVKPWMNALGRVILRSFSEGGSATEGVALRSLSEAPKGATPVKAWGSTDSARKEEVRLVDIAEFVKVHNLNEQIDLMSINIEGGEYFLLRRILESGLINRIENLQVQFHRLVPRAAEMRRELLEGIGRTHEGTFSYPFVWEGFRKK